MRRISLHRLRPRHVQDRSRWTGSKRQAGQLIFFKKSTVHAITLLDDQPLVFLAVDTPRRDPKDIHFVNPADGTPETFIQTSRNLLAGAAVSRRLALCSAGPALRTWAGSRVRQDPTDADPATSFRVPVAKPHLDALAFQRIRELLQVRAHVVVREDDLRLERLHALGGFVRRHRVRQVHQTNATSMFLSAFISGVHSVSPER